jgi:hypothetical protein
MGRRIPEATARLALRRLSAVYLALSGSVLLLPGRPGPWLAILALHVAGILLLLDVAPARPLARGLSSRWPRPAAVLSDWYALLLIPFLYAELGILNTSVHGGRYFDETILRWEAALFGGQPSQELATAFPSLVLSEALHFFYLSYYLIIYLPPLYLYARRRLADHQHVVFVLMLAFVAHYLFFIFFPVQGPRYLFPAPGGELSQGAMYRLAHAVLESGSSQGAAFPSSHVGVAFAQTALAFLFLRKVVPLLFVASAGLSLGAVYAGFHYATDALSGMILGLLLFAAAPWVARVLRGSGERTGEHAGDSRNQLSRTRPPSPG